MLRRSLLFGGLVAALAAPTLAQVPGSWRVLFDGRSLDNFTPIGAANWTFAEGAIQANNGMRGFLVSKETLADFELRAEVWVSDDANSGIFIRAGNPAEITTDNAYEVNIYDGFRDPAFGTGAIVNIARVDPMPKAGGRWNVIEVRAKGDVLDVVFNGQRTVVGARDARFASGRIALQYALGTVKWRKVEVRAI